MTAESAQSEFDQLKCRIEEWFSEIESILWEDDEGDLISLSEPAELREAYRVASAEGRKCLELRLFKHKYNALKAQRARDQPEQQEAVTMKAGSGSGSGSDSGSGSGALGLGTRPGRAVALDLKIPLKEARELVRRAKKGDELARRVVAPCAAFVRNLSARAVAGDAAAMALNNEMLHTKDPQFRALLRQRGAGVSGADNSETAGEAPREAAPPPPAPPAAHFGVTCDKSGMCPIIGNRWHLVGHDYDLCDDEFKRLALTEQERFICITAPSRGACMPAMCPMLAASMQAALLSSVSPVPETTQAQSPVASDPLAKASVVAAQEEAEANAAAEKGQEEKKKEAAAVAHTMPSRQAGGGEEDSEAALTHSVDNGPRLELADDVVIVEPASTAAGPISSASGILAALSEPAEGSRARHDSALAELASMGFTDTDACIALLERYNGRLDRVVNALFDAAL